LRPRSRSHETADGLAAQRLNEATRLKVSSEWNCIHPIFNSEFSSQEIWLLPVLANKNGTFCLRRIERFV